MEDDFSLLLSELSTNELIDEKCVTSSISSNDVLSTSASSESLEKEDLISLKRKLKICEEKCLKHEEENKKITNELFQEKLKIEKMRSKLDFVKQNQDVFMRLKEAYINMKYNESHGRKMIEVQEKSLQTYEGILCKACIKTEQTRVNVNQTLEQFKDAKIITKDDFEKISAAINFIKSMIQNREKQWALNSKKELNYKNQIENLTKANNLLKNQETNLNTIQIENVKKEMQILKKIIIKFEKRNRNPNFHTSGDEPNKFYNLDETEIDIVNQLVSRFDQRVKDRKKVKRKFRSKSHVTFESSDMETTQDFTMSLNDVKLQ